MLLTGLVLATLPAANEYVLEREAAQELSTLLRLAEPLPGGRQMMAQIERDHVVVSVLALGDKPAWSVTLRHASRAPEGASPIGTVTIDLRPGPRNEALSRALEARIAAGKGRLTWRRLQPQKAPTPAGQARTHRLLDRALYNLQIGRPAKSRALLGSLPLALPGGMRLRAARLWRQLGQHAKVGELLSGELHALYRPAARLLKEPTLAVSALVKEVVCGHTSIVGVLRDLARYDDARSLAHRIRTVDPKCETAWALEAEEWFRVGDDTQGMAVAQSAVEALPGSRAMKLRYAGSLHKMERFAQATRMYEAMAREEPDFPGILRLALGAMLRDVAGREAHKSRLEGRLAKDDSDLVSQFLRGVLHHYENEFHASDKLLMPLQKRLAKEQRLDIYLAMNAFNEGEVAASLERLNRAAEADMPDPDIFYCRAEILRDTDRPQAMLDLKRYLATSERSLVANKTKQTRVKMLLKALEGCHEARTAKCPAEWEHPRLRRQRGPAEAVDDASDSEGADTPFVWLLFIVLGGVALLGGIHVRRSRADAPDPR